MVMKSGSGRSIKASYVQLVDPYDRPRTMTLPEWAAYEPKSDCVVLGLVRAEPEQPMIHKDFLFVEDMPDRPSTIQESFDWERLHADVHQN